MRTDQPPWCGDHEGIAEPTPSVVFDLGTVPAATPGAWAARVDAINAEALRCFVIDWNDDPNFVVLDWQHLGYTFDAEAHAAAKELAEWRVPIYPNGDYYIFSRDDFHGRDLRPSVGTHAVCVRGTDGRRTRPDSVDLASATSRRR